MDYFQNLVPMRAENKHQLGARMYDTVIGVIRGWFLTSLIQGLFAILGYWIAGVEGAVLLGLLTSIMGLMPVVGTAGVSLPIAIYFLVQGHYVKGTFLLLWAIIIVIGLIDTVIRPYLMAKKAELPMFALFFALLGGMEAWGAKGMILGPLLIAIAPILLDMYHHRYFRQPDVKEKNPEDLPSQDVLSMVSSSLES
jgi:predicted PurR-regulated permease PerM